MTDEGPRERYGWKLSLAVLLNLLLGPVVMGITVLALHNVFFAKSAMIGLGAVVAYLAILLIVWAVLFFKFTQRRTVLRGIAYFLVLLVTSLAVLGALAEFGYLNDKSKRAEAGAREAAQVHLVLVEGDKAVATAIGEHGGTVDLHTGGNDEAARIARAAKTLLHVTSDAEEASRKKLDDIHFPAFMAPAEYRGDPNFERARRHVAEMRAILGEHERALTRALSDYRTVVAGASIDAVEKASALKRIDTAIAAGARERARKATLVSEMLGEFEAQLQDFARTRNAWQVHGVNIIFTDKASMTLYERHAKAERAIFQEMEKSFSTAPAAH